MGSVGRPLALILLMADESSLVGPQLQSMAIADAAPALSSSAQDRSQAQSSSVQKYNSTAAAHAADWLHVQLPALEAAARTLGIPVARVHCEGGVEVSSTPYSLLPIPYSLLPTT